MGGPTAAETVPGFSEFLNGLAEKLAEIPPRPIFASGEMFPAEHAWSFSLGRQQYMLAHASFWEKVPVRAPTAATMLAGIPIIDIDDENPRNAAMRDKVLNAIAEHLDSKDASTPPTERK